MINYLQKIMKGYDFQKRLHPIHNLNKRVRQDNKSQKACNIKLIAGINKFGNNKILLRRKRKKQ